MILWHYTSIDVLVSIFSGEKPTLRASHISHLNDSEELRHGLKGMQHIYKKTEENKGNVKLINKMLKDNYDPNIYSFSLSEKENSLYQWLAYCPRNGGVSLGFKLPLPKDPYIIRMLTDLNLPLIKIKKSQPPIFGKCRYFAKPSEIKPEWIIRDFVIIKDPEMRLLINATFLKHRAFEFEEEHRLFFLPAFDSVSYVPAEFQGTKPYINFHFDPKILERIYISPRGNQKLTTKTVKKFLFTKGLTKVRVIESKIPFRE